MLIGGRFTVQKRLGKGAFGSVYLVQDFKKELFALKQIQVARLIAEPHLRDYLKGEIKCMKEMKSPHITQFYQVFEEKQYIYILMEYCCEGDLLAYQCSFNNKVFPLKKALQVLKQVIIGLEDLHRAGYLHRDIKAQNILVTKQNEKEIFKLADFGFSKKTKDVCKTILGTNDYMSPEVFENYRYGYEVDMWAFGVMFYYMLNQQYPFKLNPHWSNEKLRKEIIAMAVNFSFKASVKNSKLKLDQNCTPDMEDLFKKIFDLNPKTRINFFQIRKHPVFATFFPSDEEPSKIFYEKPYALIRISSGQESVVQENQNKKPANEKVEQNTQVLPSRIRQSVPEFLQQQGILNRKKDQIDFLKESIQIFFDCGKALQNEEKLMLAFNLLKYYIILLKNFKQKLDIFSLNKVYPDLKWNQFLVTKEFKQIRKQINQDINESQLKFLTLFDQCNDFLPEIIKINPKFQAAFDCYINQEQFQGPFRDSYRKTTSYIYKTLKDFAKAGNQGNKGSFLLAMVLICHTFNDLFDNKEKVTKIFSQYLNLKKVSADKIDCSDLRMWMSNSNESSLIKIAKQIIQAFI